MSITVDYVKARSASEVLLELFSVKTFESYTSEEVLGFDDTSSGCVIEIGLKKFSELRAVLKVTLKMGSNFVVHYSVKGSGTSFKGSSSGPDLKVIVSEIVRDADFHRVGIGGETVTAEARIFKLEKLSVFVIVVGIIYTLYHLFDTGWYTDYAHLMIGGGITLGGALLSVAVSPILERMLERKREA